MRSLFENKRLILILAVLALGALTILAISLNEVPFRAGQRFSQGEAGETPQINPQDIINTWVEIPVWQQVGIWLLLATLVILAGFLLSPEMRRLLIRRFIRLALTFWGLLYIFEHYPHLIDALDLNLEDGPPVQNTDGLNTNLPAFVPPHVSPVFAYLISFAFALILFAVIWALYRGWQKYTALMNPTKSLDEIARIARSSLNDLSSGMNSGDVIINCYLRMSEVVSNKRHLYRAAAMTPREFALRLEQAGVPGDAVKSLTRLFEGVRYGDRKSGSKDVSEAVSCLETILHYCGEPG